jgi:hypothetical protein
VIDTLINASLEVRVCSSQTKAVLASTAVDLLPFGLGSNEIQDSSLPLQPADTREPFKVCSTCNAVYGRTQNTQGAWQMFAQLLRMIAPV